MISGSLFALVIFTILLVGIWKKNHTLLKVHRILLIINYIAAIMFVSLVSLIFTQFVISVETPASEVSKLILFLLLIVGIALGLLKLHLWIVDGVIAAIESEGAPNEAVNYLYADQKSNPHLAPV